VGGQAGRQRKAIEKRERGRRALGEDEEPSCHMSDSGGERSTGGEFENGKIVESEKNEQAFPVKEESCANQREGRRG